MFFTILIFWLLIGFAYGIKIIFVEQLWDTMQELKDSNNKETVYTVALNSKLGFMIVCTLSGVLLPLATAYHLFKDK